MIIVRLRGGLGNQFFQFAAGKALAEHHKTSFKLDLYYYKKHPNRKFELNKFNAPIDIATREEVHQFTGSNPLIRFINKYNNYFHCPEVFAQPHYHYYEDFFHLPGNLYLSGYLQCEKYFTSLRDNLVKWYTPKFPLDDKSQSVQEQMLTSNSVSLHVRRGDYGVNSIFASIPEAYYKSAIDFIKERIENPKFFIFSDDIDWCRKNLNLPPDAIFVDHNTGDNSYKDLVLMSECKHHVMANSTFSWWGAWLDQNPDKIVIAPKEWFNNTYYKSKTPMYPTRLYNSKDIIPEGWITL